MNNNRKYNTEFRKKLINKIEKLDNNMHYINIYNIINKNIGNNFSINRNGIFINLNLISDDCINNLIEYLNNNNINNDDNENDNEDNKNDSDNINYNNYFISSVNENKKKKNYNKLDDINIICDMGYKLSNQEKNILKRLKS